MCFVEGEVVVGENDVDKIAEVIGGWGENISGVEGCPAGLEAF